MQISQLSPNDLPIAAHLPTIVKAINNHRVVVVSGKTGCGKSTQVPKALLQAHPLVRIAVCQPRRVAATSLAVRVAQEVKCKLGTTVGYHIGMESFRN
jgi:HrpA-like RNA helicase